MNWFLIGKTDVTFDILAKKNIDLNAVHCDLLAPTDFTACPQGGGIEQKYGGIDVTLTIYHVPDEKNIALGNWIKDSAKDHWL